MSKEDKSKQLEPEGKHVEWQDAEPWPTDLLVPTPSNWEILPPPEQDTDGEEDVSTTKKKKKRESSSLFLKRSEGASYTQKVMAMMILWNGVFLGITFVTEIYWLLVLPHHLIGYMLVVATLRTHFNSTYVTVKDNEIRVVEKPMSDGCLLCADGKVPRLHSIRAIRCRPIFNFFGVEIPFHPGVFAKEFVCYQVYAVYNSSRRSKTRTVMSGLIDQEEAAFLKQQLDNVINLEPSESDRARRYAIGTSTSTRLEL